MSINTTADRYSEDRRKAEKLGAWFEATPGGILAWLPGNEPFCSKAGVFGRNIDDAASRLLAWAARDGNEPLTPRGASAHRFVGADRPSFMTAGE